MATEWLTVREAVEQSGYNYDYLRALLIRGRIAGVKKGNAWWVDRRSLFGYMKASNRMQSKDKRHGAKAKTRFT
jgi:hypothetical protein